jgi:hypothetical protein
MPGGSPYLTAQTLQAQPAGLSWVVVPTLTAPSPVNLAQLQAVCWTATTQADGYCRQPLRASVYTEQLYGPGQPRVSIDRETGIASLVTRYWPVTAVNAVQVSPRRDFPPQWTLVTAGQAQVRHPPVLSAGPAPVTVPSGGNVIDVAPDWLYRRRGHWSISASYTAGYPHAGLTAQAAIAADALLVDDVTGWAGWTGWVYDGEFTEPVQVETAEATSPVTLPGIGGTVQAGPGTLTLASPLVNQHAPGTVISALPLTAIHGVALLAAVQALETIDAIAVQSMNGQSASLGALAEQAELMLDDFRRVA